MTNDEARARTVKTTQPLRALSLWMAGLVTLLAGAGVGADCSGSSTPNPPISETPDASSPVRIDAGSGRKHDAGLSTPTSGSGTGDGVVLPHGSDAGSGSGSNELGGAADDGGCVADFQPCGPETRCCSMMCTNGACGSCLAEGNPCEHDGDCCSGLACTSAGDAGKFCGTNLCSPDGTVCGGGTPCCNDDCIDGVCGGS